MGGYLGHSYCNGFDEGASDGSCVGGCCCRGVGVCCCDEVAICRILCLKC